MSLKRKGSEALGADNKRQKTTTTGAHDSAHWWQGTIDPQPVGLPGAACPIDWNLVQLPAADRQMLIDIYELRTPWKPVAENSFSQCQAKLNQTYNKSLGGEAWRKKFMKTNLAVFDSLKIWYEQHASGLQRRVGVPPKTLRDKGAPKVKQTVVQRCDDAVFTLCLQEPGMSDGQWLHESKVSVEIARGISPALAYAVNNNHSSGFITASRRTVDLLISCFAPKKRAQLPKYGHRLEEASDGGHAYIEYPTNITQADLFDLYALATGLKCTTVCDMVLDRWHEIMRSEVRLREDFQTGRRAWTDIPAGELPNILSFEPRHLNMLWETTAADDMARAFWLDAITSKGEIGYEKIGDDLSEYCDTFLADWQATLFGDHLVEIDAFVPKPTNETAPDTASATSTPSRFEPTAFPCSDPNAAVATSEDGDTQGEMTSDCASASSCSKAALCRDAIIESIEDHPPISPTGSGLAPSDANHDGNEQLERAEAQLREAEEQVEQLQRLGAQSESPEDSESEGSVEFIAPELTSCDPNFLLNYTQDEFCGAYHNHHRMSLFCYRDSVETTESASSADDCDYSPSNIKRPAHHVSLTIRATPGFVIQNHTGYSAIDFQDFPTTFPDWDWERIRAVTCYEHLKQSTLPYGRDPCPLILPTPVYFADIVQDEFGRYPSHPGYRSADWVEPDRFIDPYAVPTPDHFEPGSEDENDDEENNDEVDPVASLTESLKESQKTKSNPSKRAAGHLKRPEKPLKKKIWENHWVDFPIVDRKLD
jgi:hypothetical protein